MTTTELRNAVNKMNAINTDYSAIENKTNADYRVWWRKLYDMKIELCDTPHWDYLVDMMDFVKSQIKY